MGEAEQLGFPAINIELMLWGTSWDESVYKGTRQFHQAKGFDPDSQDVARELGYPLYAISKEPHGTFAHVEEIWDEPSEFRKVPDSEPLQEAARRESGPDPSPAQKGAHPLNNAVMDVLPNHWNIIFGMQFTLIVTLGALWLCDRFH
ncbi:hypothetical protein B0H17DRAFT_1051447 [Mycena rosella]|uniref:Uncharacterized protein n=1 Tax=Mycena rosella TaxID=1033263 RepID=A0AAD7GNV8_MYCRO|nr:hypothetical protein B0H17DRAFT_1051447 [Mycena rosella]